MKVDKRQFEKVLSYIDVGMKEGATLLTGGKSWGTEGYYIEPTVFVDVEVGRSVSNDAAYVFSCHEQIILTRKRIVRMTCE